MNYQMTTKQLEQEHSALQVKVRNASPSEYGEALTKLGRVQALLSGRYAQSVKLTSPAPNALPGCSSLETLLAILTMGGIGGSLLVLLAAYLVSR
jgi:hypothetical protein